MITLKHLDGVHWQLSGLNFEAVEDHFPNYCDALWASCGINELHIHHDYQSYILDFAYMVAKLYNVELELA